MDTKTIVGIIVAIIIIIGAIIVLGGQGEEKRIDIVGSTSVQPVAEKLANEYMKKHPDVKITVQGGGSSVGITQAQQGTADIGTSSKELKEDEKKGLKTYLIGRDGIVVIVNKQNNIQGLTTDQIKDIFSGKIRNWKEVGGPDAPITVITREEGSGTRKAFEEIVMKDAKIRKDAIVESSTEAVKQAVKQDPNAIGFISLTNLDDTVKALEIDGVIPSEETVADGSYKLQRPFLFLTKGEPTGVVKDFIDWVLSPEGQAIVKSEKVVPVKQ
ncbi:MAG TPA: phosphate ABC transporter substrate-binding protein [Methanothermobacter sp.]|jgi:phosphate transport system substrate-binding protein|uniref:Phosphate-binding protein n=1 Tax=Methanothermobacter tenebrarum TaxID=680118 RepID=A0ABN6PHJ1_9EURY|nr:phosphate ABC transporter substrate-binding protein [Methanothermobacter tenebrarum]MDD3453922.1 phosphate ABC transporter substrate-binding protein [Methanobacteriales archaeon]MDI6882163.1 phosphate ABC transporter substrate-binding protein [Methanothermobacter sp.]MDX9692769.1 phosphate ABC transporter substrate-binding protein [Methanothermobacter sp.]BDH80088.1 phosphate-binding protein [Methanothermobacter tenebrarum]HHW15953.1 phosphate ABC transporter substrate-binding protein [Meth